MFERYYCPWRISSCQLQTWRNAADKVRHLFMPSNTRNDHSSWQNPEDADGGADILAGDGPMGFGSQRICIEVKSGDGLTDRPTVDKLMGAMTKFNATQGLFVSWGGFKGNVQKELASSFFRVRLWIQHDLLEQLFLHYEKLDDEIKDELPLKRVWTLAMVD